MRPNLFANTPDILHEYLQYGGRPAFMIRLVLAATLGATYGIYGPPFELCVGTAVRHGSEEYLDSEKYQVRHWDLDAPGNLRDFITRINEIRRENPALHDNRNLRFFPTDNDQIIAYGKATPDLANIILVVVNLDPHHTQSGWVRLPLAELGLAQARRPFQVHDLIGDARYLWHGESNFVQLDPFACPGADLPRPAEDQDRKRFRLLHVRTEAQERRRRDLHDVAPDRLRPAPLGGGDPRPALRETRGACPRPGRRGGTALPSGHPRAGSP